jgi:hypothetical protein
MLVETHGIYTCMDLPIIRHISWPLLLILLPPSYVVDDKNTAALRHSKLLWSWASFLLKKLCNYQLAKTPRSKHLVDC